MINASWYWLFIYMFDMFVIVMFVLFLFFFQKAKNNSLQKDQLAKIL